ncbi:MAG TPA: GYF domain-containing protein [Verrucomicrobiae bacterium]|nr:GYF domain-containing protein [Verrucomicrobiae bacterium]
MYKIIGGDGKEYGPVTAEQLRQWIVEGRANAQTKVQAEGSTEWKTLAEFPEFSGVSGTGTNLPPPPNAVSADGLAAQILLRGYEVDIGNCISRGWNLLKEHFGPLVGTSLLIFLLIGGVGNLLRVMVDLALGISFRPHGLHGLELIRLQWPGMLVSTVWNLLVGGALLGGLYHYYLKLIRGQPATLADAFRGFSKAFTSLTSANIAMGLLGLLGFLLCVIPGVYLGVAWRFTLPLVIDKQLGFWEAMELSRKVVTRQWFILLALFLVAGIISISGLVLCCIGIFATAPIGIASFLYAYEDIFGGQFVQPTDPAQTA